MRPHRNPASFPSPAARMALLPAHARWRAAEPTRQLPALDVGGSRGRHLRSLRRSVRPATALERIPSSPRPDWRLPALPNAPCSLGVSVPRIAGRRGFSRPLHADRRPSIAGQLQVLVDPQRERAPIDGDRRRVPAGQRVDRDLGLHRLDRDREPVTGPGALQRGPQRVGERRGVDLAAGALGVLRDRVRREQKRGVARCLVEAVLYAVDQLADRRPGIAHLRLDAGVDVTAGDRAPRAREDRPVLAALGAGRPQHDVDLDVGVGRGERESLSVEAGHDQVGAADARSVGAASNAPQPPSSLRRRSRPR